MIVKVCGMREAQNLSDVEALGVDLIGMIFWRGSRRYVSEPPACPSCPSRTARRVGVFVGASVDEVVQHVRDYGLAYVQLHGDETPAYARTLREALRHDHHADVSIIRAIHVRDAATLQQVTAEWQGMADLFLFETPTAGYGGSGESFDWSLLRHYQGDTPFLLSGGIGPQSMEALRRFRHPQWVGVDLNSRFESAPALKDVALLRPFVERIRTLLLSLLLLLNVSLAQAQWSGSSPRICLGPIDTTQHLSMLFVGDLMQHKRQIDAARQQDGSYDYTGCFDFVRPEIERADVALGNLEVTMGGTPYAGYPCFSAPDAYLSAIQQAGFDLLFTANNHCCDRGLRGIRRTIQLCDSLHLPHVGTYVDAETRQKQYPYLLERNGFRIAFLVFTYGTNGLPVPSPSVVNLIDTAQIRQDIRRAQLMHPDLIIAVPHWGIERVDLPPRKVQWLAQWLIDEGVDHVIGGHPHVIQPIELRIDPVSGGQHLVAYSLSNFLSDMIWQTCYGGMMLRLEVSRDAVTGAAYLSDCGYTLTWVSLPVWSHRPNYRVYPIDVPDAMLNAAERRHRDAFAQHARALFGQHNLNVHEYSFPLPQLSNCK